MISIISKKKKIMKLFISLGLISAICLFVVTPVSAYLDPGTGSMIFQTLIAILLGVSISIRIYWIRIKEWFLKIRK